MNIFAGVLLAGAVGLFGSLAGFDRERGFYPVIVVVTASYYALFAVLGGSMPALWAEGAILCGFAGLAVIGFKRNPWIAAAALLGHGVMDIFHGAMIDNPGLPAYWPMFCLSFDVAAALYLAVILIRRRMLAHAGQTSEKLLPA